MIEIIDIADNLNKIRQDIRQAELRAGRTPGSVQLLAVSKFRQPEDILIANRSGICDFGENRVQEMLAKQEQLAEYPLNWHLIGKLQINKVKQIIGKTVLIHSLDRWSLAEEIQKRSTQEQVQTKVLVEVNISGETTKGGLDPQEVIPFLKQAAFDLPSVQIKGLMTMAPMVSDPEEVRWVFRDLRLLAEKCCQLALPGVYLQHLSMGMSNDFQVAVEEGADIVRIGSKIFGERN